MARKGLGRGLEAILGDDQPVMASAPAKADGDGITIIPIGDIAPDPDQPRKRFDEEELASLAASIKAQGLLQPILVGPKAPNGRYLIIAGERRWRAAAKAGVHEVPALVREVSEQTRAELALVENLQRSDLNPMEEADAYSRIKELYGRKPQDIADAVGKSRSHVANMLRLTTLPQEVRAVVESGQLSMGHARAILGAPDPVKLAAKVIAQGLSVRETERLAKAKPGKPVPGSSGAANGKPPAGGGSKDADTKSLERDLEAALGLSVAIEHGKKGGTVTLTYDTLEQLDDICRRLMGTAI